jgi:hypothetical protein
MRSGKEIIMLRTELLLPFLLALFLGGAVAATSDSGSGMDPDGRPEATTGDRGSIMDPDG